MNPCVEELDCEETDGSSSELFSEKYPIPDRLTNFSFKEAPNNNKTLTIKKASTAQNNLMSSQESSAMNIPNEHSI